RSSEAEPELSRDRRLVQIPEGPPGAEHDRPGRWKFRRSESVARRRRLPEGKESGGGHLLYVERRAVFASGWYLEQFLFQCFDISARFRQHFHQVQARWVFRPD